MIRTILGSIMIIISIVCLISSMVYERHLKLAESRLLGSFLLFAVLGLIIFEMKTKNKNKP